MFLTLYPSVDVVSAIVGLHTLKVLSQVLSMGFVMRAQNITIYRYLDLSTPIQVCTI